MKNNTMKLKLLAGFVIAVMFAACSSTPEIGFYNSQEVLQGDKDVPAIEKQLEDYVKTLENEFSALKAEQAMKQKKFSADSASMSETVRGYAKKELDDITTRVAGFPTDANQKFATKRAELYAPITSKLELILKGIAKTKGYSYILESSTVKFAFADSSNDITSQIKTKFSK